MISPRSFVTMFFTNVIPPCFVLWFAMFCYDVVMKLCYVFAMGYDVAMGYDSAM